MRIRLFIMALIAGALAGCGAVSSLMPSQNKGQDAAIALPTVQVPLLHVGLQGRPSGFKDWFIQDVSAQNAQW
ncbi:MAG: hypothetical protein WCK47_06815 [bacterium]|nr:hypothetical protein [Candidatus Sumerlaeota bacterium]